MGLSSALGAALSGLKASQSGLDLVAANVANAQTPGYVKRSLVTSQQVAGGVTVGVRVDDIRRELDAYIQRQLRTETSGSAYASTRASYLNQLQTTFGTPGGDLSFDTLISDFSSTLDALATTPDDASTRAGVVQSAQVLAQQLNSASSDIQDMRSQADLGMKSGVDQANAALQSIQDLTKEITKAYASGQTPSALLDQRDQAIDALSGLMDVKVENLGGGQLRLKTQSGLTLFEGGTASTLKFEPTTTISAEDAYSSDPSKSTLGTISLVRPSGYSVDLLADGQLRSGQLRALADMRDKTLPAAQTQLDELAANLAQTFGTKSVDGTAISGGVDLTTQGALSGDRLTVSYTSGGVTRTVTIVNVADASKLPLDDSLTADPNDTVIGVDFSSPTAAADLDAALSGKGIAIDASASATGFALTSSDPSLTVDGGASKLTATALSGDGLALPLFTDGSTPYSGSIDGDGQRLGFAGRIAVNPALVSDNAKLVSYSSSTAAGDPTRAEFLRDALKGDRTFSLDSGLGASSRPFTGSLAEFANGIIADQASASASASRVADGQSLVVSTLTDSYSASSGVNTDEEMGRLIQLQTAYGANARVISAVKEMMDMLLQV